MPSHAAIESGVRPPADRLVHKISLEDRLLRPALVAQHTQSVDYYDKHPLGFKPSHHEVLGAADLEKGVEGPIQCDAQSDIFEAHQGATCLRHDFDESQQENR